MAEFTITIKEEDGGLSILCSGEGSPDSPAGATARALMRLATGIVPAATQRAALASGCQCEQCKAARALATTEPKPTLH